MKKHFIIIMKSTVVALVNVCFLCGAGHVIDWMLYLFKRSGEMLQKQWQAVLKIINNDNNDRRFFKLKE